MLTKQDLIDTTLIVLTGGKASRLEPLSFTLPKGLLSLGNQPAINHMLTSLVKRGLKTAVFVTSPYNNKIVEAFVSKSYPKLEMHFVIQNEPLGALNALQCALPYITQSVLLLYGDTLCNVNFSSKQSFFGVHSQPNTNAEHFGLIKATKQNVITRVNYTATHKDSHVNTIIGVYYFKNHMLLRQVLNKEYPEYDYEHNIYGAQQYYIKHEPTLMLNFPDWFDSGSLVSYPKAVAHYTKKQHLVKENDTVPTKNVDYLTLSEYYAFYPIREDNFRYIFSALLHAKSLCFKANQAKYDERHTHDLTSRILVYFTNSLAKLNGFTVNNTTLLPIKTIETRAQAKLNQGTPKHQDYIHGDLNFINVLYSPRTSDFRFVNSPLPANTTGDKYWDAAALYASAHYGLAEIDADMFSVIKTTPKTINYSFFTTKPVAAKFLDEVLEEHGYSMAKVELLSAIYLLFQAKKHNDKTTQLLLNAMAIEKLSQLLA